MMLTELAMAPSGALPLAAFKDHLRLGSGFSMPDDQDLQLESQLRAALAAIELRTAKALLERSFRLELATWSDGRAQPLPLAPVASVTSVMLVDAGGLATPLAVSRYRLLADAHRPRLEGRGGALPQVPEDGRAVIEFRAGFGVNWSELPADLRQAVFLLAAEFHEHRHEDGSAASGLPSRVSALIERWRLVRLLGGGAR